MGRARASGRKGSWDSGVDELEAGDALGTSLRVHLDSDDGEGIMCYASGRPRARGRSMFSGPWAGAEEGRGEFS